MNNNSSIVAHRFDVPADLCQSHRRAGQTHLCALFHSLTHSEITRAHCFLVPAVSLELVSVLSGQPALPLRVPLT